MKLRNQSKTFENIISQVKVTGWIRFELNLRKICYQHLGIVEDDRLPGIISTPWFLMNLNA